MLAITDNKGYIFIHQKEKVKQDEDILNLQPSMYRLIWQWRRERCSVFWDCLLSFICLRLSGAVLEFDLILASNSHLWIILEFSFAWASSAVIWHPIWGGSWQPIGMSCILQSNSPQHVKRQGSKVNVKAFWNVLELKFSPKTDVRHQPKSASFSEEAS